MDVRQTLELIAAHQAIQEEESKSIDEMVRWYNGEFYGGETRAENQAIRMHTNYAFALVDSISAALIPQNPRVHAKPVSPGMADPAKLTERLLDQDVRATKMDDVCRRSVRWAVLAGRNPAKVVWMPALEAPRVWDLDPKRLWWDFDVPFEESEYYIEVTTVRDQKIQERIANRDPGAPTYDRAGYVPGTGDDAHPAWLYPDDPNTTDRIPGIRKRVSDIFRWRMVYEIHWPTERRMQLLMPNAHGFLFDGDGPYPDVPNPYVMLAFNDRLRDHRGMSDCSLIRNQQLRLNEMDFLAYEHALRSIPGMLYDSRIVSGEEAELLANMRPGEYRGVSPPDGRAIGETMQPTPQPTMAPDFHIERNRLEQALQFVVGLPDWMRGQVVGAETATEMALTEQALKNRFTIRGMRVRQFQTSIVERFLLLRRAMMREPVDVGGFEPGEPPRQARVEDLAAVLGVEIVAYDPMEYNKGVRRAELLRLRQALAGSPHIDIMKMDREILALHEADPSLVVAPAIPPAAAAQTAALPSLLPMPAAAK